MGKQQFASGYERDRFAVKHLLKHLQKSNRWLCLESVMYGDQWP